MLYEVEIIRTVLFVVEAKCAADAEAKAVAQAFEDGAQQDCAVEATRIETLPCKRCGEAVDAEHLGVEDTDRVLCDDCQRLALKEDAIDRDIDQARDEE